MTFQTDLRLPDQGTMFNQIEWLCEGSWYPHRYEIAWGHPDGGPTHARTFDIDDFWGGSSVAMDANLAGNNVYVGMTMKRYGTPASGRTRAEHALLATCMVMDFDRKARAGFLRINPVLRAALMVVTGTVPEPRIQLGIRLVPTEDLDRWARLLKTWAQFSGADTGAIGVNRLVRLAGTISYPSSAKRERGYIAERTMLLTRAYRRYTLDELELAIPSLPRAADYRSSNNKPRQGLRATPANVANILSALRALPPLFADEYSDWLETGFALHDFNSGPVGLALWRKFSERSPSKAVRTDFDRLWANFGRPRNGARVTLRSLIHHAKAAGWRAPYQWDRTSTVLA